MTTDRDWTLEDTLNFDTWKVLRDSKQRKAENGRISFRNRANLIEMLRMNGTPLSQQQLSRLSDDELMEETEKIYQKWLAVDVPKVKASIEKAITYMGEVDPGRLPTVYNELKKIYEKEGFDVPGIGNEHFSLLVALGEVEEKIQKGETVDEADLPDALTSENLAKYLIGMVEENDYKFQERLTENPDYKQVLEEITTKVLSKLKPIEKFRAFGGELQQSALEKIAGQTTVVSEVMQAFKDKLPKITVKDGDKAYSVFDRVGQLYEYLGRNRILEREYVPV